MTVDEEIIVIKCLNKCWDILKIWRLTLRSFKFINDDNKGFLFPCISQHKLSFFEMLVVARINDVSLESNAWYKWSYYRGYYIRIDFHIWPYSWSRALPLSMTLNSIRSRASKYLACEATVSFDFTSRALTYLDFRLYQEAVLHVLKILCTIKHIRES